MYPVLYILYIHISPKELTTSWPYRKCRNACAHILGPILKGTSPTCKFFGVWKEAGVLEHRENMQTTYRWQTG